MWSYAGWPRTPCLLHRARLREPQDPRRPGRGPPRGGLADLGRCHAGGLRPGGPAARADRRSSGRTPTPSPSSPKRPGPTASLSRANHTDRYADALRDGVVRPVIFLAYSRGCAGGLVAGDEVAARLGVGMTRDLASQAWRTALDPEGEWVPAVSRAADTSLVGAWHHEPAARTESSTRSCARPAAGRRRPGQAWRNARPGSTCSGPGPWSAANPDAPRPSPRGWGAEALRVDRVSRVSP